MNTVGLAICLLIAFNVVHSLLSCVLEYALHQDERESLFVERKKSICLEKLIADLLALGILLLLFTFGPQSMTIRIYGQPKILLENLHELRIVLVLSLVPAFLTNHVFPKMGVEFDKDGGVVLVNDRHAPKAPSIEMEIRALKMTKADRNLRLSWLRQISR